MSFSDAEWLSIKKDARNVLLTYATACKTITYNNFTTKISAPRAIKSAELKKLLEEITKEEAKKKNGLLPVVLVNQKSKLPKKYFFKAAERLKRKITNKKQFVLDERQRLYDELTR